MVRLVKDFLEIRRALCYWNHKILERSLVMPFHPLEIDLETQIDVASLTPQDNSVSIFDILLRFKERVPLAEAGRDSTSML